MTRKRVFLAVVAGAVSIFAVACTENGPTGVTPTNPSIAPRLTLDTSTVTGGIVRLPSGPRSGLVAASDPAPRGPLTRHSGTILYRTDTYAIFWGTSWNVNQQFTADKITTIQSFFGGFGASAYANIATEYGASNQSVFKATLIDNSSPPPGDPGDSGVASYVCGLLASRGLSPDPFGFYAVYTTTPYPGGFLGYHGFSSCRGVPLHFAIVFNLDGKGFVHDGVHHTDNAAVLADVTAHELMETITDADVSSGWFATNTAGEIGDKCNFKFAPSPYVTLSNGGVFKIQGEWSNAAFSAGTGFAGVDSEPGCVISSREFLHALISGWTSIRQFQTATYTADVGGGTPPYSYDWQIFSNLTFGYSSNTNPTFNPTLESPVGTPTPYTVELILRDAAGAVVNPDPQMLATASP